MGCALSAESPRPRRPRQAPAAAALPTAAPPRRRAAPAVSSPVSPPTLATFGTSTDIDACDPTENPLASDFCELAEDEASFPSSVHAVGTKFGESMTTLSSLGDVGDADDGDAADGEASPPSKSDDDGDDQFPEVFP